jgi:hypothetical protein
MVHAIGGGSRKDFNASRQARPVDMGCPAAGSAMTGFIA